MPGPESALPPDYSARLAASLGNWKRKLLDLSRRNRALNFKPAKISTVAIIDEQPAEVFRRLYLDEGAMRFKASATASTEAVKERRSSQEPVIAIEVDGEPLEFESESQEALPFVPYDRTAVDERHSDEWLQTKLTPEALDHSLRRIEEQARSTIEEQGVNTLFVALGMLQYRESRDSDAWIKAPLVLLPVELSRKSARSGYTLSASDDDAMVNPALVEYLRASNGIALPELPESEAMGDSYDLQDFLKGAADAVKNQEGWAVQTDMYLSLFSFQKLVMFKDLESNGTPIGAHRLVQQLLSRSGGSVHGLPQEIRDLSLDASFSPESTHQVVDADSSQMRAAAAVVKGHDIVIEGPPGTGKSQTITNLVAQALAAGKSVLFVAEKMAALDVVHRRLVGAGLGEFCLELHSSKANKRAVMKELSSALDSSLQAVGAATGAGKKLPELRKQLDGYVKEAHRPTGALGMSPFRVAGELGLVLQAPRTTIESDIGSTTADEFESAERGLRDLATHAKAIGPPGLHAWRDATKTLYTEDSLYSICSTGDEVRVAAKSLLARTAEAAAAFGLPSSNSLFEFSTITPIADLLAESPGVKADILQSDAWNEAPLEATRLIEKGRKYGQARERLLTQFKDEAFETDHSADIAYVELKSGGFLAFLAFLDGRFRSIKSRWIGLRREAYNPSMLEQATELKHVDQIAALGRELAAADEAGQRLFGVRWKAESSDWKALERYLDYVVRYRRAAVERGLGANAALVAEGRAPDVSALRQLPIDADSLRAKLTKLADLVGWPNGYLQSAQLTEIIARVDALVRNATKAPAWAAFEGSRQRASTTIAKEVVAAGMAGTISMDELPSAFRRAFFMKWMTLTVEGSEQLQRFDTLTHEGVVTGFRDADRQVMRQNQGALVSLLRDRTQNRLREGDAAAGLSKLRREMAKQRNLSPLRRTLRECEAAIRAIKPCFMMSPLTVAQYLDGQAPTFDLVIFDEASQLPTEEAIGAIVRGRQLVVVGDPKQLPPTNFFAVSSGAVSAPLGDDGAPLFEDSESVLEEFMGAAVPMCRLKWHYRSAHESLISFSNVSFYDSDLHTFPSVATGTDSAGIQFHFVPDGVYEGKGVNLVEARRIADEVVAFAKLQLERKGLGDTPLSLGVGTLNLRQQMAILDELEVRRRADPAIEPFFDRSVHEPFFVKNLENIQGDERDSIFLSITYGKSVDGRLRYNFGPLNRENGWRRLNVLVTRARRQMKVFSSIREHDINPAGAVSDGPRLLRDFLGYAEHGRLGSATIARADDAESPFERDVYLELTKRGIQVQPQVGVSGYRIDLGVVDKELPGRFVCGIECDGMAYHSMETVRDRDRLRQQVLEDRGWIIHRVWSTDWFKDRQGQIDRLLGLIQRSREHIATEAVREREEGELRKARALEVLARRDTAPPPPTEYVRPEIERYKLFDGKGVRPAGELAETPVSTVASVVALVVGAEGPVHEADVIARICDLWDTKAGSRIQAAIRAGASEATRLNQVQRRGPFYWRPDGVCRARSRSNTGIPGDRIAPEEYSEAIKLVLGDGQALQRQNLITEVRAVMGFSRTGALLEEAIGNVVDALLAVAVLGEASGGLTLRNAGKEVSHE